MKEYVEQMIERREELLRKIKYLKEDAVTADGLAYSEITLRISRLWDSVKTIDREIRNYTFFGPDFPEWVRNERNREQIETERKTRVQSAMEKLEAFFGGKK